MSTEPAPTEETGQPAHEPGTDDGQARTTAKPARREADAAEAEAAPAGAKPGAAEAGAGTEAGTETGADAGAGAGAEAGVQARTEVAGGKAGAQLSGDASTGASADARAGTNPKVPAEAGTEAGVEADAQVGPDAGAEAEAAPAGAKPGAAEAGAEAGTEAGADTGARAGTNPEVAAETGAEAGVEARAEVAGAEGGAQRSDAEAELARQRELREQIARRKAERDEPIESGAKLHGKAADLLAAVRAVESGAKPVRGVFEDEPTPRRRAPEPARRPEPTVRASVPVRPGAESVEAARSVLGEGGAPVSLAEQATAALGESAETVLRADPWQLLRIAGVRPEQADGFARTLLGEDDARGDERRNRAVAVWLLEQAAVAGHTALDAPALESALGRYGVADADAAVQSAISEGDLLVFQDALEATATPAAPAPATAPAEDAENGEGAEEEPRPVRVLMGLERYALAEESLADGLARVVNSVAKEESPEHAALVGTASGRGSTADLIRAVAGDSLVLHTGGEAARAEPAALVAAAVAAGLRVCAATHTAYGRRTFAHALAALDEGAAQAAGTEHSAASVVTVAGLLSGAEGPGRDAEGAFAVDLLVVLDAPQLDVEAAAMLVESLPDGARLVLSGDPGVLWSAGPGRVFADLLGARVCPVVVSRTPDEGPIGELLSGIGIGELNQVAAPGKEVMIVPVRDAGEAVHRTVQLVAESVPRAFGLPADATQVITVGHGGGAGTRALNAALKERLNPGPGRFGGFDPDDRVAYSPAPGSTRQGRVVRAGADGLHLECEGEPVVVPKEQVEQSVRHGWALTAHQAAGQRWPAAVVVLPGDAAQGLTRAWVYTAFGRGERHLSVVHGVEQALPRAVAERPAKPRTTRLGTLLRAQVPTPDGTAAPRQDS